MYFYVEYTRISSDFSKAIIWLKKIIYEKISFLGGGEKEEKGKLKIPREVIILHASTAKIF